MEFLSFLSHARLKHKATITSSIKTLPKGKHSLKILSSLPPLTPRPDTVCGTKPSGRLEYYRRAWGSDGSARGRCAKTWKRRRRVTYWRHTFIISAVYLGWPCVQSHPSREGSGRKTDSSKRTHTIRFDLNLRQKWGAEIGRKRFYVFKNNSEFKLCMSYEY